MTADKNAESVVSGADPGTEETSSRKYWGGREAAPFLSNIPASVRRHSEAGAERRMRDALVEQTLRNPSQ